jgi:hypothetical protein
MRKHSYKASSDLRHIREVWSSLRFLPGSDTVWVMAHKVPPGSVTRPSLEARILDCCRRSGWTVTELSKSLGALESSILTILIAYEREGHIIFVGETPGLDGGAAGMRNAGLRDAAIDVGLVWSGRQCLERFRWHRWAEPRPVP